MDQYSSLTGLHSYVTLSNLIGGGVPTPSSEHISVRLIQYSIAIKTRILLILHLQLVRPPTLIYEPHSLLLPPAHGRQVSRPPLLRH